MNNANMNCKSKDLYRCIVNPQYNDNDNSQLVSTLIYQVMMYKYLVENSSLRNFNVVKLWIFLQVGNFKNIVFYQIKRN